MSEPLVLLPGMMCDARLFAPQIARFSAERKIVVAPLVNHASFEALAEEILGNAPPQFALAGLSMGGIAAMETFRQAPERITRLALLDTNPLAETPDRRAARELQIEKVQAGRLRQVMREEMKPNYLMNGLMDGLTDGQRKREILDLCMDMAEALGADVFVNQSRALQGRRDQCGTLQSVHVPTLILCGAADALCPVERHELMRDLIPGAKMRVVPNAGHLPVLEQPDAVNEALREWLSQPGSQD